MVIEVNAIREAYHLRLKQLLLTSLIIIFIVYLIALLAIHATDEQLVQDKATLCGTLAAMLGIAIVFLVICFCFQLKRLVSYILASAMWCILLGLVFLHQFLVPIQGIHTVGLLFIVLLVTPTILFPRKYLISLICEAITVAAFLLFNQVFSSLTPYPASEMAAIILISVCHSCVALFFQYQLSIYDQKSFKHIQDAIIARTTLEKEKNEQELLLLSAIPAHIAVQLKQQLLEKQQDHRASVRAENIFGRKFRDMHISKHDHVSILFADVVNFTPLAEILTPRKLVEVLNRLFAKFDALAQENDCMRIKLLGDCYYCISGLPISRPGHAKNCVQMGLDMIKAIRGLHESTQCDMDMRIGVHTGAVLCGLLGVRKFQFDIYSLDVTIANRLESTGMPGKVHVSNEVVQLLISDYQFERGNGENRDSFLKENNIETFFVVPPEQVVSDSASTPLLSSRPKSRKKSKLVESAYNAGVNNDPVAEKIEQLSATVLEEVLQPLALSHNFRECCRVFKKDDIHPMTLQFCSRKLSIEYFQQADKNFYHNLIAAAAVYLVIVVAALITSSKRSTGYIALVSVGCVIFATILLLMSPLLRSKCVSLMQSRRPNPYNKWSEPIGRTLLAAVCMLLCFAVAIWNVFTCCQRSSTGTRQTVWNGSMSGNATAKWNITPTESHHEPETCSYEVCLLNCALSFFAITVFVRILYLVKFVIATLNLIVYIALFAVPDTVIHWKNAMEFTYDVHVAAILYIVFTMVILHRVDRMVELISKLNFLWKYRLKEEHEAAQRMGDINKVLVENILPKHVAERFLEIRSINEALKEPYHESYDNIAVLFASIPNYVDIYGKIRNEDYKENLRVLNEIIVEFDEQLCRPKFSSVDKIKTCGSTYMAAAGLNPGLNANNSLTSNPELQNRPVLVMTEYALTLFKVMKEINENYLQDFGLRVGICNGPAVAGIIGTLKPVYDIWGNTVNVASRMDSTGEMGKIQVPQHTATILTDAGYKCEARGEILVKGKGRMVTYWIRPEPVGRVSINKKNSERHMHGTSVRRSP